MKLSKHVGPAQATPYPTDRLSPVISVSSLIKELEVANKQISIAVTSKLKFIQSQIEYLQKEAIRIVESAKEDLNLHKIPCSFEKRVGITYYLYERNDESRFFSILSPEDWGYMIPGTFKAAFKLEADMTWTEIF